MTRSPLTDRVELTSDSSSREGTDVDHFILHHAATPSLAAILSLFMPGGRTVSANYALGNDGTLVNTVDEDRRAWTTASGVDDRRSVTIEVANAHAGDPWPVTDASFDKLARLIADVATRHAFPIDDDHVLTHQEVYQRFGRSYATACPGDLQRRKGELLELARHYQTIASPTASEEDDMTPDEKQKLDDTAKAVKAMHDALFAEEPGAEPRAWSHLHKHDFGFRQFFVEPSVDAPGGPQKKWTFLHFLGWVGRVLVEINDRSKRIADKVGAPDPDKG